MKIIILALLLFAGCSETIVNNKQITDIQSQSININIADNNGIKVYSESLPLINVQQFRELTTNNTGNYIISYDIPNDWGITFESETISFSSIDNGSVLLNWTTNTYYQFAITTESIE